MLSHFLPGDCSWGTLHLPATHLSPGCAWTHVHSGERPTTLVPWCLPRNCERVEFSPRPQARCLGLFSLLVGDLRADYQPVLLASPPWREPPSSLRRPHLPDHTPSSLTQLCSLKPGMSWSSTKWGTLSSWPPHYQHMEGKP